VKTRRDFIVTGKKTNGRAEGLGDEKNQKPQAGGNRKKKVRGPRKSLVDEKLFTVIAGGGKVLRNPPWTQGERVGPASLKVDWWFQKYASQIPHISIVAWRHPSTYHVRLSDQARSERGLWEVKKRHEKGVKGKGVSQATEPRKQKRQKTRRQVRGRKARASPNKVAQVCGNEDRKNGATQQFTADEQGKMIKKRQRDIEKRDRPGDDGVGTSSWSDVHTVGDGGEDERINGLEATKRKLAGRRRVFVATWASLA